jgi:hypothetical protein
MKRILSAALVFAIVGTALAFSPSSKKDIYCPDSTANQFCTIKVNFTSQVLTNGTTNPCGVDGQYSVGILTSQQCPTGQTALVYPTTDN